MGAMLLLYSRALGSGLAAATLLGLSFPVYLAAVYVTLAVTIPHALLPRRYWRVALLIAYTILGVFFLETLMLLLLIIGMIPFPTIPGYRLPANAIDAIVLSAGPLIVAITAAALKLLRHGRAVEHRALRLEREKLEAELAMLRAQVHPHFLFNTLNNLYALTLRKSEQAPDVVLRLSALLDYMLYESSAETVLLSREAALIEQYLSLERLRYGPDVRIAFERQIDVDREIAPLLFLPLVENSFKHGLSRGGTHAWVDITLRCTGGELRFTVENSLPAADRSEDEHEGIGMWNVRDRLTLLYPRAHALDVREEADRFFVALTIVFPTLRTTEPT